MAQEAVEFEAYAAERLQSHAEASNLGNSNLCGNRVGHRAVSEWSLAACTLGKSGE